jgi:tRNA dimethylallyltransferase
MIDIRSISHPMNAADYAREAFPLIDNLLKKNKLVYLVGGSGFYLQALLKGMYDSPTTPSEIILRSDELFSKEGIVPFIEILKKYDVESLKRYHENDFYRIRRAVEHLWVTGSPMSLARDKKDKINNELERPSIHPWNILHLYLEVPKDLHLEIIKKRSEKMLRDGLLEEVKALLDQGFSGEEKPLQSIGYRETLNYLQKKYKTTDEYEEQILISTRQLAKSQKTWFKRDHFKKTFNPLEEKSDIFLQVDFFLKNN